MTMGNMNTQKTIEGLVDGIMELESFRPPISIIDMLHNYKIELKFSSKTGERPYFKCYNPDLEKKLQNELDPYFKKVVEINFKDIILLVSGVFFIAFLCVIIFEIALNVFLTTILVWISCLGFMYFLLLLYANHKRVAGEEYEDKIKNAVQEFIYRGIEVIREKELDPTKHPIKLKHNDYLGLEYISKEKNYYFAYLKE